MPNARPGMPLKRSKWYKKREDVSSMEAWIFGRLDIPWHPCIVCLPTFTLHSSQCRYIFQSHGWLDMFCLNKKTACFLRQRDSNLGVWNVFCFRGWWWLYVSYNLNVWCMAARFFSLTDKLSSLVGLAMVVRPFFELKHQQLDSSEQDACFLNHISMTLRRIVLDLFFMNISLLNPWLVLQFDGSLF